MGSVIIKEKKQSEEEEKKNSLKLFEVIDGQQRLTTLSILLRACFDQICINAGSDPNQAGSRQAVENVLYCVYYDGINATKEIKLVNSRHDYEDYQKVISGEFFSKDTFETIIPIPDDKRKQIEYSSNILRCYRFFRERLSLFEDIELNQLFQLLATGAEKYEILVNISLEPSENEQAIFDTINTAGIRLTSADMIKNTLFKPLIDKARNDQLNPNAQTKKVWEFYDSVWDETFAKTKTDQDYWSQLRSLGRFTRDNLEILLHNYAVIKGIYDPEKDSLSSLPTKYESFLLKKESEDIRDLITDITTYASTYKDNFFSIVDMGALKYDDKKKMLIHILDQCDISTFNPYVLKLLKDPDTPDSTYEELMTYAIWCTVCKATTKNFNKECAQLIKGNKTVRDLIDDRIASGAFSDDLLEAGLRNIGNSLAKLILFWIELYRRSTGSADLTSLPYAFSLEHVMPQTWKTHWDVGHPDVYDVESLDEEGNPIKVLDYETAAAIRKSAIYEIGNMTLLNASLNGKIKNSPFKEKMEYKDKGIKCNSDLRVCKDDIIPVYDKGEVWDERKIHSRTVSLMTEFKLIWKLTTDEDNAQEAVHI